MFSKDVVKRFCVVWVSLVFALVGCSGQPQTQGDQQQAQPQQTAADDQQLKQGGVIKVAVNDDPPTLDQMSTGSSSAVNIAYHIFEQLFALDQDLTVKPMLAKGVDVSEDKKTYTIQLREGVKFHDGTAMNADDVIASIKRWGSLSRFGKQVSEKVQQVSKVDDYTIQIQLKEEYAPLLNVMAGPQEALIIVPAEIAQAAGEKPLETNQLIGTGPYKFDRWEHGQYVSIKRFDDYAARDEDWGGLTGKKVAYADEIRFIVIKDAQVRVNGLRTGEYDYAVRIPKDLYEQIKTFPEVKPIVTKPDSWLMLMPDKSEPPFDDVRLRKAINHALDREKIGLATYGPPEFFQVDGSIFFPEQKDLYTTEGTEPYHEYDPEKAKQLMKEAGYDGQTIRMIATSSYEDHYNSAQAAAEMLKGVGFNVDLQFFEWATFVQKIKEPGNYDIWVSGFPPVYDLTLVLWVDPNYPGWWKSERMQSLLDQWTKTIDPAEQKRLLVEVNKTVYEEFPLIKMVNEIGLEAASAKLQGYEDWLSMRFWNVAVSSEGN
ncbi:ABC transporter substrate-binding protein [Brevibacillus marinus]|uniref:ABC transporter substrate-binding protein n=1 Tax=Brevibacillus marinus TaxID=2496837 RepID=UPI0013DFEDD5|nr:ABC transporter substrate-binding protein [Brevibacillus marinus]